MHLFRHRTPLTPRRIRWAARLDRWRGLPRPDAAGPGETEQRIAAAAEAHRLDLTARHAMRRERLLAACDETGRRARRHEDEAQRLARDAGRHAPSVALGPGGHLVAIALLALCDLALVSSALEVLALPVWAALAAGTACAMALLGLAELAGRTLRQARAPYWRPAAVVTAILLLLGVSVVALATLRAEYLAGALGQQVVPDRIVWAFAGVTVLIYGGAIAVGYAVEDPHPGLRRGYALADRWARRHARATRALEAADQRHAAELAGIDAAARALVAEYRRVNRRGRRTVPAYFDLPVALGGRAR